MGEFVAIERVDDPRLAAFRLRERGLATRADKRDDAGAGLFLAEGDLVVERALAAGCVPVAGLADGERLPTVATALVEAGVEVYVGGEKVRAMVTGLGVPHSIVALFQRPPRPTPHDLVRRCRRLVVVEAVDNPANVGAIVRNAAAFGWDGLLLDLTSADPLARRALRVAMGTAFAVAHARARDLAAVLTSVADLEVVALTPDPAATPIQQLAPSARRAVVIGSERCGVSEALRSIGIPVRIPMAPGVDSLNAAAAAAVACFALSDPRLCSTQRW